MHSGKQATVGGRMKYSIIVVISCLLFSVAHAQQFAREQKTSKTTALVQSAPMDNRHLESLLRRIDKDVKGKPGSWKIHYEGMEILVMTDTKADRMRIVSAVVEADQLDQSQLYRLMQANFDSALDARYAIARNYVWSAFNHPLSSLNDRELFSGLAQVITLTATFGSSYSSGAMVFDGGDGDHGDPGKHNKEIMRRGLNI